MTPPEGESSRTVHLPGRWLLLGALPLVLVVAGFFFWRTVHGGPASPATEGPAAAGVLALLPTEASGTGEPSLPSSPWSSGASTAIRRIIDPHTVKPDRPSEAVTNYTVQSGDTVFGIADQVKLKPTTIYWANFDTLMGGMLSPGQVLRIPPVDGIYYKWQEGDTFLDVATRFKVSVEDILNFAGNNLDPLNPQVLPGDFVMIPGGVSASVNWAGPLSVTENVSYNTFLGPNGCGGTVSASPGSGNWVWPAPYDTSHLLSGNNFSSWHPGVDIMELAGWPIKAADGGVVIYAGGSDVGYGNLVVINHLDGWQTYYAHLSRVDVACGVQVVGGEQIGLAGSTGNSTGPHLHFEMHYNPNSRTVLGAAVDPHTIFNIIP
ncbi:MAG: M23 family metallopeptidase [Anaerolineales bacterium]|jgi:murein DD-endopeptidase MepM/ murein hydrolase activator NlpD